MSVGYKRILLAFEFVLLFVGVPLLILFTGKIINPVIVLLPVVIILIVYFIKHRINWQELFSIRASKKFLSTHLFLIIISSLLLIVWVYSQFRTDFLNLPRLNFKIWITLILLYPIFSASLQEIAFRVFLFRRYRILFTQPWAIMLASAVEFSFAHIFYSNALALVLTLIQGLYLSYLYHKTRSFLLIALIHSFYGNLVFTIGLGEYFWLDMHKYL